MNGRVHIVGAGPGDPELLTLKARRVIENADVILYDRLIAQEGLGFAKPGCELVNVGKEDCRHLVPQEQINELLVRYARQGRQVVRLKGGDPFVFGRGCEEALFLAKNGIEFEIIPGVSSSVAAPAYAGIPLTHRGMASSFAVVTGHSCGGGGGVRWSDFKGVDTLVIMMGVSGRKEIARQLIAAGRDPNEPIAVVQSGGTSAQKRVCSTLKGLAEGFVEAASPAVIVVGRVVELGPLINPGGFWPWGVWDGGSAEDRKSECG